MKIKEAYQNCRIVCISFCFIFFVQLAAVAQDFTGKVVDKTDGTPLADVTIRDNQNVTKSQTDGTFRINAQLGAKLEFSLLGYQKLVFQLNNRNNLTIELERSEDVLEEVVVTALGIKRETKGLSYATQQVSAEAVSGIKDNSGNFVSALTGKVAGAVVSTTSGGPGSSARIVLRGNKSITGNNNALMVIDGIVFDNTSVTQSAGPYSNVYSSSDGGANINPEDIESINVLKGPSAAALYGSRAVNGAIIITTKQGAAGRWKLDVNSTHSFENVSYIPGLQNNYGRGNGGALGANATDSWGAPSTTYADNVKNFFNTGYSNSNSISASGGSEKVQSYFSVANGRIDGVIPENYLNRNNVDLRINTELVKGLKTDLKLSYINQDIHNKQRLSANGIMAQILTMPRDMDDEELKDYETINPSTGLPESKFWSTNVNNDNPYWSIYRNSVNEKRDRIVAMGSVSYQFTPWLNFMTRMSMDRFYEKTDGSFYNSTKANGNVLPGGQYYLTKSEYSNRNIDFLFTGATQVVDEQFQLNYVLGSSLLTRQYNTGTSMANGLTVPNNFSLAFASTPTFQGISAYKRHLNSVYGSLNLAMWESLYLDFTARNDWSSTLPAPHSYFYPSVGLSFVMNKWLSLPSWIDLAKVRGSYTMVGNDAEPNLLNQTYTYTAASGKGFITRNPTKSIQDLKPEKTTSYEGGFDFQFFGNRLGVNGTLYKSNSINQLIFLAATTSTGFDSQYINAGDVENKGFELQLTGKPILNENFTWESILNFARNTTKINELTNQISSVNVSASIAYATVVISKGGGYGDLYGAKWKVDPNSGKYVVNNLGMPVVETGKPVGNYNPSATLGWSNNFKYKNWGFHINVDGRIGGEMVSGTAALMADYGVGEFTTAHRDGNWVIDAVDQSGAANTKAINAEGFWTTVGAGGIYPYTEFFTFDMTNFRIRNLGLSYSLPNRLLPFVKSAQLSASMNNVLFLYKGKSILDIPGIGKLKNPVDPEASIGSGNFQGVEAAVLPLSRTFTMGVKLSF